MKDTLDDVASLVAEIGTPGLGPALMGLLHRRCGADLCSVFALFGKQPSVLIAESQDSGASAFARIASLRYVQRYWRRDIAAVSTLGRAHRTVQVLKRPARGIRDIEYQHECYTEGAVTERLSLYRRGAPAIIANAYRERSSGAFEPAQTHAFADMSTLLHAALERHARLSDAHPTPGDPAALARRLEMIAAGLSHREAQVTAMTIAGLEQPEIAATFGIRPSSVITYRKRAYQKLGVSGRHQLRRKLPDLLTGEVRGGAVE